MMMAVAHPKGDRKKLQHFFGFNIFYFVQHLLSPCRNLSEEYKKLTEEFLEF